MKKLSILIFLSVILLFTGCSQKLEDGILKVDKEYKEKNAKTKVYYVDNNYEKTREQLNKLVNDLNNNTLMALDKFAVKVATLRGKIAQAVDATLTIDTLSGNSNSQFFLENQAILKSDNIDISE